MTSLSPAEQLQALEAAKQNGSTAEAAPSLDSESLDSQSTTSEADTPSTRATNVSTPSITDELAFPALGGGKQKAFVVESTKTAAYSQLAHPSAKQAKSTSLQDIFFISSDKQLNIQKSELNKILTEIKNQTKTNIETTFSAQNNQRTFLVRGSAASVKSARKLIMKKLSKPTVVTFSIPYKLRSAVIGAKGRNLKPIIDSTGVKVNIEREVAKSSLSPAPSSASEDENDEDIFSVTSEVQVEGDSESCLEAKTKILAIVNELTKTLSTKIVIDKTIKPFVTAELEALNSKFSDLDISIPDYNSPSNTIRIAGDREQAIQAKADIKDIVSLVSNKIITKELEIPVTKQKFIPVDTLYKEFVVLVELPASGSENKSVKFIGQKQQVEKAITRARQETTKFKAETLEISKAHKGDLNHAKVLAKFFTENGIFDEIANKNQTTIASDDDEQLQNTSCVVITISGKSDESDKLKSTKKEIVDTVNKYTPSLTKHITDIDEFLLPKVGETLSSVCKEQNVSYVVLGSTISLIASPPSEDDFVDDDEVTTKLKLVNDSLNELRELSSTLEAVVLHVESKNQKNISGPNNTTLKSILSSVEPNTVVVKLHSNKEGSSEDEVLVHGLKAQVSIVRKDIEKVLKEAEEYKELSAYQTLIEFPSNVLSRLIGKNGGNMNELREEFGVKIDVDDEGKEANTNDKDAKSKIIITGIKRNADECKIRITQLGKKWADETLVRVKVENKYHKNLIGPNGVYVNRLQDKYNVKIRFPQENGNVYSDSPKSKDEITVRGPSKGVAKVQEEIKELIKYETENGFKKVIQVPSKAVARVIGKGGETINDISADTGVEYRFDREGNEKELGYIEVTLTGSKTGVKEAETKINDIITEAENFVSVSIKVDPKYHRQLVGTSGSTMKEIIIKAGGPENRREWFRLLQIPNEGSGSDEITSQGDKKVVNKIVELINQFVQDRENSVVETVEIPKEKHRLLIGPQGSIRRNLQDEYSVSIDIPRANEDVNEIKLTGLAENISKLKTKISELTKDDWNDSVDVPEALHGLISERGGLFRKLRTDFGVEVGHGPSARKAAKLSNSSIPVPPESSFGESEETKFTIVEDDAPLALENTIPWRLKGNSDGVAKAKELIAALVEQGSAHDSTGWFYSSSPSKIFNRIVGPQGSKIQQLKKKTGCFIVVPRTNDKADNVIYMRGNAKSLELAKNEILKIIK